MNRRRKLLVVVTIVLVSVLVQGCSQWLPLSLAFPGYVVNREGHYYAGARGVTDLAEIGVFMSWPTTGPGLAGWETAIWHAVSSASDTNEFELFSTSQTDVSVLYDSGSRPHSQEIFIVMLDTDGGECSVSAVLDRIGNGQVRPVASSVISWTQYVNEPDTRFRQGCNE